MRSPQRRELLLIKKLTRLLQGDLLTLAGDGTLAGGGSVDPWLKVARYMLLLRTVSNVKSTGSCSVPINL